MQQKEKIMTRSTPTSEVVDSNTALHSVLERQRRFNLCLDAAGSSEINMRIAAVLVPNEGESYSTTVLLNETGIPRGTLLRHIGQLIQRGFVIQSSCNGATHYAVTSKGAQLCRDTINEIINIVGGEQIGFSSGIRQRMKLSGNTLKPGARTIAFSKINTLSKMDRNSVD